MWRKFHSLQQRTWPGPLWQALQFQDFSEKRKTKNIKDGPSSSESTSLLLASKKYLKVSLFFLLLLLLLFYLFDGHWPWALNRVESVLCVSIGQRRKAGTLNSWLQRKDKYSMNLGHWANMFRARLTIWPVTSVLFSVSHSVVLLSHQSQVLSRAVHHQLLFRRTLFPLFCWKLFKKTVFYKQAHMILIYFPLVCCQTLFHFTLSQPWVSAVSRELNIFSLTVSRRSQRSPKSQPIPKATTSMKCGSLALVWNSNED